jgi:hypothetical protein
MNDHSKGLYRKFNVERTDGTSALGGKHEGCEYFVLDLTHDKHAMPALQAYAASCAREYPALADDLKDIILRIARSRTMGAYKAGFEDCRNQALRIVDEHEGYYSRIEIIEPCNELPTRTPQADKEEK